jgi:hypothetical protein
MSAPARLRTAAELPQPQAEALVGHRPSDRRACSSRKSSLTSSCRHSCCGRCGSGDSSSSIGELLAAWNAAHGWLSERACPSFSTGGQDRSRWPLENK